MEYLTLPKPKFNQRRAQSDPKYKFSFHVIYRAYMNTLINELDLLKKSNLLTNLEYDKSVGMLKIMEEQRIWLPEIHKKSLTDNLKFIWNIEKYNIILYINNEGKWVITKYCLNNEQTNLTGENNDSMLCIEEKVFQDEITETQIGLLLSIKLCSSNFMKIDFPVEKKSDLWSRMMQFIKN